MRRQYVTADVFTSSRFEGNQVAVVLEADELSTRQMQSIANEFSNSETAFVVSASAPETPVQIRIFTPTYEIPFSIHPVIATAFVLATQAEKFGVSPPDRMQLGLKSGEISVRILRSALEVTGAELTVVEEFSRYSEVSAQAVALCLSLSPKDIRTLVHTPQLTSTGSPYLIVELTTREALRACIPNQSGFKALLPLDGATSIYAYTRDIARCERRTDIQARIFTEQLVEDSSVGKAATADAGLLATAVDAQELSLRIGQGTDMGRPSQFFVRVHVNADELTVHLGGNCVEVLEGTFNLMGDAVPPGRNRS
jgi:trans-2,3-dihydro-3-hydroxyanthranilate isomerase